MFWDTKGSVTEEGTSGTTDTESAIPALTPQSLLLIVVGTNNTAKTVSSMATTTGSGVFTQVAAISGTAERLEIWIGRNFTGNPTGVTVTFSQTTGAHSILFRVLDVSSDLTSAPTATPNAGQTGTSTAMDTGTFTPAVGDICVVAGYSSDDAIYTARTDTGNTFIHPLSAFASTSVGRVAMAMCVASAAASSKEVWTLPTSQAWAAIAVALTMPADASASAVELIGTPPIP